MLSSKRWDKESLADSPFPTLEKYFLKFDERKVAILLCLEKRSSSGSIENSTQFAFKANVSQAIPRKTEDKSHVWCGYCNKPRHTRETCWKLHGKWSNWKSKQDSRVTRSPSGHEANAVPFGKELMDHLLKLLKSNSGSYLALLMPLLLNQVENQTPCLVIYIQILFRGSFI